MAKDLLIRSVAAVAVLGCGIYFAFGVAADVAASQPGTAIRHNAPITLAMLWQELSGVTFKAVVAWFPVYGGFWLLGALSVASMLAAVVLTLAVNPRIFHCSRRAVVTAGLVIGVSSPFG